MLNFPGPRRALSERIVRLSSGEQAECIGIVLGTRVNNNTIAQKTENDLQTQLWGIS